jgi:DNA-binding transcriptional LysR family regulator
MDGRNLKYVVTLAKVLSFTKAAEQLGISQSALSKSIQAYEKHANVRLFDRDRGANVHLTPVGKMFAERAAEILREANDLDRTLKRAAHGVEGEVAIGMSALAANVFLPSVLRDEQLRSDLRIHVAVRTGDGLLPLLLDEKIEFIVDPEGTFPPKVPLKKTFLGWFPLSMLVRKGHPLLKLKTVTDVRPYPLISAGSKTIQTPPFAAFFKKPADLLIEDYTSLLALTETSDAVWVTSPYASMDAISSGRLVEIPLPLSPSVKRIRMMIYSLDRRSLSPAALKLKEAIRAHVRSLSRTADS